MCSLDTLHIGHRSTNLSFAFRLNLKIKFHKVAIRPVLRKLWKSPVTVTDPLSIDLFFYRTPTMQTEPSNLFHLALPYHMNDSNRTFDVHLYRHLATTSATYLLTWRIELDFHGYERCKINRGRKRFY